MNLHGDKWCAVTVLSDQKNNVKMKGDIIYAHIAMGAALGTEPYRTI